ncbi:hypothetical protein AB9F27_19340 [Falsihalocynthiibacter sp. CO-5D18]
MRYAATEKLESIQLGEGSHLSARQTLAKLGIRRTIFYRPLSLTALQSTVGQRDKRTQGSGLGLALSQHYLRRLQPLDHLVEALHQHAD